MEPKQHKTRAHALLSASGAHRWLNCTPSAVLEDKYGERTISAFAAEGTLAHELAELFIRQDIINNISEDEADVIYERIINDKLYSAEMPDYVNVFVDYCRAQYQEAQTTRFSDIRSESRVDLRDYVPESFGTVDCAIVSEDTLEIIDLKYGKGVPVYAEWNPQLMLYALGMLAEVSMLYNIAKVRCTIVQPRIDNISSWEIAIEDLYNWADNELRPKAEQAFTGSGELASGDWCRFCAVKNKCRKLYEDQLEIAKYDFKESALLSDKEIVDVLSRGPQLVDWVNSIAEYAREKAVNHNKNWPGFKLVAGRANRRWRNEDEAATRIAELAPELPEDEIFTVKLNGITDIEKKIGKKKFALLGDVVIKPTGTPVLVPLTDKRPALGVEDAKNDFKN